MSRISSKRAKELNQNFINTRSKAINKAINKDDAISSWFSLDEIKKYIAYIESEAKAQGISVNGLRVYFGAYPAKDIINPKNDNLSTVFFVPTTSNIATQKSATAAAGGGSDVETIDGLNLGTMGNPPSAPYPQQ
ncbi:hypothetical protein [Lutibacter sp.]